MLRFITVLIITLFCFTARAQTWELGFTAGGAGYMSDLNQRNPLKVSGFQMGGFFKRNFNSYLSVKVQYTLGQIQGADSTSKYQEQRNRNLSFITKLHELSLIGEFNFMQYQPGSGRNYFTPFIYGGIGVVKYNPQALYRGTMYDLRPLTTEGQPKPYGKTALTMPYGVGIKYNVSGNLNVMADIGYRNPSTDYLDDVSGYYAPAASFTSPAALALSDRSGERTGTYSGAAGTQRGDLRKHDTYMFIGFTISYTFVTPHCYY